jgi:hypothetical protein
MKQRRGFLIDRRTFMTGALAAAGLTVVPWTAHAGGQKYVITSFKSARRLIPYYARQGGRDISRELVEWALRDKYPSGYFEYVRGNPLRADLIDTALIRAGQVQRLWRAFYGRRPSQLELGQTVTWLANHKPPLPFRWASAHAETGEISQPDMGAATVALAGAIAAHATVDNGLNLGNFAVAMAMAHAIVGAVAAMEAGVAMLSIVGAITQGVAAGSIGVRITMRAAQAIVTITGLGTFAVGLGLMALAINLSPVRANDPVDATTPPAPTPVGTVTAGEISVVDMGEPDGPSDPGEGVAGDDGTW